MADVGVRHLDGDHAELARRLQVDAQVVEEHRLVRFDVEALTGEEIEARIGLSDPYDRGLHHRVEEAEHVVTAGP